ncbi:MAG: formate dehydrogenase subunit gamma, partial [Pseudomonadota bacterium]
VSIPDKQAGMLIQSEGEAWRQLRNGKLSEYGAWLLLAVIVILGLFYAVRGRIRIEAGVSGKTVERFNFLERLAHWLTAVSFIVLGLTGLNLLYGRDVLLPLLGADVFSAITIAGKYAHNFVAFAFMAGLLLMLVLWTRQNLPDKYDFMWVMKGGGMFSRHSHPLAKKFNFGQKLLFWAVIWGGAAVSVTGIYLLFPMTFATIQEMQDMQIWHAAISLVLVAVIIAHIYIGTLGMEGAFDAVGTGQVDENWAREHHGVWMAELKGEPAPKATSHD